MPCKCCCTCPKETPEQEGERLSAEGLGLSDLWGDCSQENFPHFERVLNAFVAAKDNPEIAEQRRRVLSNEQ